MGAFSRLFRKKESTEDRLATQQVLLAQLEHGAQRALEGIGAADPMEMAFWRRTFVQYMFATVDAQLSVLRLSSLSHIEARRNRVRRGGVHFLKPVDFKGHEAVDGRDVVLRPTTKLDVLSMLKLHAKSLLGNHAPEFHGEGFRSFESFLAIRARIIHPRNPDDVRIGDGCIEDCERAWSWFRTAILEPCRTVLRDGAEPPRRAGVPAARAA